MPRLSATASPPDQHWNAQYDCNQLIRLSRAHEVGIIVSARPSTSADGDWESGYPAVYGEGATILQMYTAGVSVPPAASVQAKMSTSLSAVDPKRPNCYPTWNRNQTLSS
jgi:hypothetical protein